MARIELDDIAHRYTCDSPQNSAASTPSWAVKPMTTTWVDGGAYALLGPSGCGKTTLLNIISGLVLPTRGRVLFDGRDVTSLAPEARNIAQVFQFPVVYDTMTVFENLAFPLHNRSWTGPDIRRRVHEIAEILDLTRELPRRARALSADQKQKISLGRGLVRPDVAAVLFDEPLTVIDPHLKWLLRRKLKQIHQQLRLSLIYVTHDQTEALTFADRVAVMSQGEIVQTGTPQELFEAPAHRFVGHFLGAPGMNFLRCTWRNGAAHIGDAAIATASTRAPAASTELHIGIRPEYLQLARTPGPNTVPAAISSVEDQGTTALVRVAVENDTAWIRLQDTRELPQPGTAFIHLPRQHCALYAEDRRVA